MFFVIPLSTFIYYYLQFILIAEYNITFKDYIIHVVS